MATRAHEPVDRTPGQERAAEAAGEPLRSSTRQVDPVLSALLRSLQPGRRIRITQTVRVGDQQWPTTVMGAFRAVRYLATGLSTDRVPADDIVVITVHFTKDNGELSSVTVDERTLVEVCP